MNDRTFVKVMLTVVAVGCLLTLAHLLYIVYAYQHGSIVEFIARELW